MEEIEKIKYLIGKGYIALEDGVIFKMNGSKLNDNISTRGYYKDIGFRFKSKTYYVKRHRFIYYFFKNELPKMIDHIDMDKLNNSINNLRPTDHSKNSMNRDCLGFSKINNRENLYRARIIIEGQEISIGWYKTEEEAHQAYLSAKKKYHLI